MKEIVRAWGLSPGFPRGPNFFSASLRKEVLYKNLNKIGVGELGMTNIPADLTMEKLQSIAHCRTHVMMFKPKCGDKEYWQKIWLIDRYTRELGFKRNYP